MTQELRSATLHKQAGTLGPEGREQTLERGPQIWAALGSLTRSAGGPGVVPQTVSGRPYFGVLCMREARNISCGAGLGSL